MLWWVRFNQWDNGITIFFEWLLGQAMNQKEEMIPILVKSDTDNSIKLIKDLCLPTKDKLKIGPMTKDLIGCS